MKLQCLSIAPRSTSRRAAFRRVAVGVSRGLRAGRCAGASIERSEARVIKLCRARATNVSGGLIERKALAAGDGGGAGHVWPTFAAMYGCAPNRGEHEEQAIGAGFEIAARRLILGREAVCEKHDERQAFVKGGAGDLLFAWADAWRNEHRAALCGIEEARLLGRERIGGVFTEKHAS